jgi:hypothetical protein
MVDDENGLVGRFYSLACELFQPRPAHADDCEFRSDKYSIDEYQEERGQDKGNHCKRDFEHLDLPFSIWCGTSNI